MGDISLQLASECLKNSRDIVESLPKTQLSQNPSELQSVFKTILEEGLGCQKSSKLSSPAKDRNHDVEVWIIQQRQFSCLKDLIKQSIEMISLHSKQCQYTDVNTINSYDDPSLCYAKEEFNRDKLELEDDKTEAIAIAYPKNDILKENLGDRKDKDFLGFHSNVIDNNFETCDGKYNNSDFENADVILEDYDLKPKTSMKRKKTKRALSAAGRNQHGCMNKRKKTKPENRNSDIAYNFLEQDQSFPKEKSLGTKENHLECLVESNDAIQARKRLKDLLRIICLWYYETDIPVNYDILQGQSPSYYGLNARGGGKPYIFELVMLSLESPIFLQRKTCVQFYSKLFRVPLRPWKIRIRNMYLFWERGGDIKTCDKYRFPCSSKVLKELILNGFDSFNPFTESELQNYEHTKSMVSIEEPKEVKNFEDLFMCTPSSRLNCPAPNFFVAPKNRRHAHDGIEKLAQTHNPVLDALITNHSKELTVKCKNRCYGQGAFFQQHVGLIPDFGLNHVFGMVAIIVEDAVDKKDNPDMQIKWNESEKDGYCYQAKFLAKSASCPNSNPPEDFKTLYNVVIEAIGLSYHDVFRNSYTLPTTASAKNVHDHYFKVPTKTVYADLESLGEDGVKKQMDKYDTEIKKLSRRRKHVPLVDLPQNKPIKLLFEKNNHEENEFDFSKVNNISVLMGLDSSNVEVRSLLSEDAYLSSFSMKKSTATSADTNEILPWVLTDLFCTFNGFTTHEIFDAIPEYEEKFSHLRETYNKMRACKEILSRQNVICQVRHFY